MPLVHPLQPGRVDSLPPMCVREMHAVPSALDPWMLESQQKPVTHPSTGAASLVSTCPATDAIVKSATRSGWVV
eukprot:scaffold87151_cov33-Tisochrysis_lutea.AAC.3